LLKDFVEIVIFRLIQEGVKGLSKGGGFIVGISLAIKNRGFFKKYRFSREKIKVCQ
jgi:hypothetical protein